MLDQFQLASVYTRCVPGLQSASLLVRDRTNDATATYAAYVLANAQRRPMTAEERHLASMEASGVEGCVWLLWRDDLTATGAPDPREGDIVADSTRLAPAGGPQNWTIKRVDLHLLGEAHSCTCERA